MAKTDETELLGKSGSDNILQPSQGDNPTEEENLWSLGILCPVDYSNGKTTYKFTESGVDKFIVNINELSENVAIVRDSNMDKSGAGYLALLGTFLSQCSLLKAREKCLTDEQKAQVNVTEALKTLKALHSTVCSLQLAAAALSESGNCQGTNLTEENDPGLQEAIAASLQLQQGAISGNSQDTNFLPQNTNYTWEELLALSNKLIDVYGHVSKLKTLISGLKQIFDIGSQQDRELLISYIKECNKYKEELNKHLKEYASKNPPVTGKEKYTYTKYTESCNALLSMFNDILDLYKLVEKLDIHELERDSTNYPKRYKFDEENDPRLQEAIAASSQPQQHESASSLDAHNGEGESRPDTLLSSSDGGQVEIKGDEYTRPK